MIPLIVLLICSGLFCGGASILTTVVVSKSRFACRYGLLAVAVGFLAPPFIWILAGTHLSPYGYFLLASPIFPGSLGIGLSRIPGGFWLRLARTVIVLTAILAAMLGGRNWRAESIADRQLLDLLRGSKRIHLAEFHSEMSRQADFPYSLSTTARAAAC